MRLGLVIGALLAAVCASCLDFEKFETTPEAGGGGSGGTGSGNGGDGGGGAPPATCPDDPPLASCVVEADDFSRSPDARWVAFPAGFTVANCGDDFGPCIRLQSSGSRKLFHSKATAALDEGTSCSATVRVVEVDDEVSASLDLIPDGDNGPIVSERVEIAVAAGLATITIAGQEQTVAIEDGVTVDALRIQVREGELSLEALAGGASVACLNVDSPLPAGDYVVGVGVDGDGQASFDDYGVPL